MSNKWIISGTSVQGRSHFRPGSQNQDSIRWLNRIPNQIRILSIADGHGSRNHFRSRIGSNLATKVSIAVLNHFFQNTELTYKKMSQIRDIIRYSIPKHISIKWSEMVKNHLLFNPVSRKEIEIVFGEFSDETMNLISNNPYSIYGTTLLSTVVTDSFIVCFQIGDGDIIIVDECRKLIRPFGLDEKRSNSHSIPFSVDETNSLCMNSSWNYCEVNVLPIDEIRPKIILLSTDGYSNSFTNFEGFLRIGNDYLDLLDSKGPCYLKRRLNRILRNTSDNGSGDDITLGYFYRKS